jgi:hypothetical protein
MNGDPLALARRAGVAVSIEDLGDWAPAQLLSEYDASARAIRINSRCVERLETNDGGDAVRAFLRCAVAHEMFHVLQPEGSEEDAHAFALIQTGSPPAAFEAMLEAC